jgi:hypothetical protein
MLAYVALGLCVVALVYIKVVSGYAAKSLNVKGKHMLITGKLRLL